MPDAPRIRLENMESLEPEGLHGRAQAELEQLAALIRGEGLDAYVAGPEESFHALLQESAEQVAVDVLNVVYENGVDVLLGAAGATVERAIHDWARRRRCFRDRDGAKATVVIWGSSGEILETVELPPPDEAD